MLAVSDAFLAAESADVNKPVSQAFLVLGNYATAAFGASASASGSDGSGNYPASGAIDGDRTELNVGAASAADNDAGLSSWRSAVAPSVTPQTLTVDMGESRTINRIKLYHLSSHALKSFKLESSPDNSAWTLITKTTDQGGSLTTSNEVDTLDFTDVACRYVRLTVADTVVAADKANVVELEIYRLLDITDRVQSVKTGRARDYQLTNSLAATATLVLSNVDKYFSPSYVPTTDQSDFINSQLKPGLGVLIKFGFGYTGPSEVTSNFFGTIDKISVKPGARTVQIDARDTMKAAFNQTISTKLKTSTDIGALVQYMLNKVNISSWECDIDTTGIIIDYFFTFDAAAIDSIRDLTEGAGDANFFVDEAGICTFRSYLNSTALNHTDTTEADFEAGTLTNIDTTTFPAKFSTKWFLIDNFSDGDYTANPAWLIGQLTSPWFSTPSSTLQYAAPGRIGSSGGSGGPGIQPILTSDGNIGTLSTSVSGTWRFKGKITDGLGSSGTLSFAFMSNGAVSPTATSILYGHTLYANSYFVKIARSGSVSLNYANAAGTITVLGSAALTISSGTYYSIRVTRSGAGLMNVYVDDVFKIGTTHTTLTSSLTIGWLFLDGSTGATYSTYTVTDLYYSFQQDASDTSYGQTPTFVSATIDQTAGVATEGIFQTTQIALTGTAIAWYTATSADGVSWDAYVSVTPSGAIASTPRRYLRYKAVLSSTAYFTSAIVTDVTVNWTIGSGSTKFPTNVSYVYDESLSLDVDQVYADTIAGDSSIINAIAVKAQPLVLSGADADIQWQGTTGTPPVPVSVTDPIGVTNGQTLTYHIVVQGGMDISRMSGASPAGATVTFAAGAAGSWVFSSIHPTRPVLVITITGTGTITALTVQGKAFSNNDTFLEATAQDTDSIKEFGQRLDQISNQYIVNQTIAQQIADRLVANSAAPTTYSPQVKVRPTFSIQVGDRITLQNANLGIDEDSIVIGVDHTLAVSNQAIDAYTTLKLLKVAT